MRQSSKSQGKKHCSIYDSALSQRGKEAEALSNIMNSIKYLQQRVSHLPDYQIPKKHRPAPTTPKAGLKSKLSLPKYNTPNTKKRGLSAKTKRVNDPKR